VARLVQYLRDILPVMLLLGTGAGLIAIGIAVAATLLRRYTSPRFRRATATRLAVAGEGRLEWIFGEQIVAISNARVRAVVVRLGWQCGGDIGGSCRRSTRHRQPFERNPVD
jgi:hypothetical protein